MDLTVLLYMILRDRVLSNRKYSMQPSMSSQCHDSKLYWEVTDSGPQPRLEPVKLFGPGICGTPGAKVSMSNGIWALTNDLGYKATCPNVGGGCSSTKI